MTLHLWYSLSENSSIAPTALSADLSGVWAEYEIEVSALAVSVI